MTKLRRNIKTIMKRFNIDSGGSVEAFLPDPLAADFVQYVYEKNVMRRLANVFKMTSRRLDRPVVDDVLSAYHVTDGNTTTATEWSTTQIAYVAKKLMSKFTMDTEVWEDGIVDLRPAVLKDFAMAMARAEESMMIEGDTAHTANAQTPGAASEQNWYTGDPRLMFDGIVKLSTATGAPTAVDGGGGNLSHTHINTARFQLGKYGSDATELVCVIPRWQASRIRIDSDLKLVYLTGLAKSPIITGELMNLHGVSLVEAPSMDADVAVLVYRPYIQLGDRRLITIESDRLITTDQTQYVCTERICFKVVRNAGLCKIQNLSSVNTSS